MQNGTSVQQPQYDLFSPEFFANPYQVYARLRAEAPVYWSEQLQGWLITRYADVRAALSDPRLTSVSLGDIAVEIPAEIQPKAQTISDYLSLWLIAQNPPKHTRLRRLLNQGFKPRLIENLAPRIQTITDELLDAVQHYGRMEMMTEFFYPLPVMVIGEILGFPAHDRALLKAWSEDIFTFFHTGIMGDPEAITAMYRTVAEMREHLRGIIAEHRRTPQDDVIGNLIATEEAGDMLEEEELLSNCIFLLFGGHETTMNLLGNGTLTLLQHPEQLAQLRANPDLLPGAIEEFLRYESSIRLVFRMAKEDLELHGQPIRAGQRVFPVISAANRDPEQFADPDRLDLRRTPNPHLSFGHGKHFCLGASLARLEVRIAFATLLRRCLDLTLATDTQTLRAGLIMHGPETLPVTFASAGASRRESVDTTPEQPGAADHADGCPFHR